MTIEHAPGGYARRTLLRSLAALPVLAGITPMASAAESPADQQASEPPQDQLAPFALKGAQGTKLVLLGTGGGPVLGQRRHMTSHLLVSNGATYVVDCGMTVSNRIAESGVSFKSIKGVFITHHHPDHNAEYGPLLLMAWIGGLIGELKTYGPAPLDQMTQDYLRSIKWTTDHLNPSPFAPPFPNIIVKNITEPGLVMQDDVVKVTSVLVDHPPIAPAYGYRFDFKDRSIAFSGDTVPLDAVAQLAKDADVLVHEAMYLPGVVAMLKATAGPRAADEKFLAMMLDIMQHNHSVVEEVGRIAQEANVKTLVLSHLVPGTDQSIVSDQQWREGAEKHFKGKIIVGHDLMVV